MKKLSNIVILGFLWLLAISLILEEKTVDSREAEIPQVERNKFLHNPEEDPYCFSEELWLDPCNRQARLTDGRMPVVSYIESSTGKYGMTDEYGNILVDTIYDDYAYASLNEEKGEALFAKGDDWFIINYKNEIVLDLSPYKGFTLRFSYDMMPVELKGGNKTGFINRDGEVVLDFVYDYAQSFDSPGYAIASHNDLWGVIDTDGNWVLEPKYEFVQEVWDEDRFVIQEGSNYWEIDSSGKKYEQVHFGC